MTRLWVIPLVALLFVAHCASRKKNETSVVEPSPMGSESIVQSPIELDPQGSDSGRIEGLYTVYFDFDKSDLTPEAKQLLQKNAQWIQAHPAYKIVIEGHCDARGSIEYNLALGERRAKAVKRYLMQLGVPQSRLSTVSYGKERPIAWGDTEEAYAKNRRANFVPVKP